MASQANSWSVLDYFSTIDTAVATLPWQVPAVSAAYASPNWTWIFEPNGSPEGMASSPVQRRWLDTVGLFSPASHNAQSPGSKLSFLVL